ncbi:arsenate reductase family protein, partial [Slackia isoflavoniconvertens]|uniref:arsenate reductase family protein n=1 Tax=Slackia isoflavoniconvertens TaxID=572010 RepID=UPI003076BA89
CVRYPMKQIIRFLNFIFPLIDPSAKDADTVALVQYLGADQKFDKVLENQQILREPIVRNGRQATVGYQPDIWKGWE